MYKRTWFNEYPWMLPRIASCATQLRNQSPDSQFPSILAAILSVKENPKDHDCLKAFPEPDPVLQAADNSNRVVYQGDLLDYAPERDASGKILHFHVTLRPRHYAEEGVRSYFMDDSGVVHATTEDRPATSKDPESLPCEGGGCEEAPTP